jgi:hypothetical protein
MQARVRLAHCSASALCIYVTGVALSTSINYPLTYEGASVDPTTLAIGTGLITNALSTSLGKAAASIYSQLDATQHRGRERKKVQAAAPIPSTVVTILEKAALETARKLEIRSETDLGALRLLLISPETHSLLRQLFSARLLNRGDSYADIRLRFDLLLQRSLRLNAQKRKQIGDEVFPALVASVAAYLEEEARLGSFVAVGGLDSARLRVLRDEITAIRKGVNELQKQNRTQLKHVLAFEEKYRSVVGARHSYIVPPHLNDAQKIPLEDLYVAPGFLLVGGDQTELVDTRLGAAEIIGLLGRVVVLGNPGGGKSTFASKLCHDMSQPHGTVAERSEYVTPILVVLREYAAENRERKSSILQYITAAAAGTYQIDPPTGAFEYLLANGRALVIFDGLDELLETHQRQKITADVETFCRMFPSAPVVVTSREVGYEQAPLDRQMFRVFRLAAFEEHQVEAYATKWFSLEGGAGLKGNDKKAATFMSESQSVPDLRANPLMLGLMCNIYREEHYIPRNRPDVYRKCAELLFDRWDRRREIPVRFRFESEFRPAMAYLAYWIYSSAELQAGVSERQLIHQTAKYLSDKRFEDHDEAEAAARDFVEFCRGRAWVFTNTGSTGTGDELYQFTHRTFLEYFTALYLTRTHETSEALAEALVPKIARREWDVVSQLAFQIRNTESEGAGDRLLTIVLEAADRGGEVDWYFLSFAARCLEFLIPTPNLARLIAEYCFEKSIQWAAGQFDTNRRTIESNPPPQDLVHALAYVATENRLSVARGIRECIEATLHSGPDRNRITALDLALHLGSVVDSSADDRPEVPGAREYLHAISQDVSKSHSDWLVSLSAKDWGLATDSAFFLLVPPKRIVEWHGVKGLFHSFPHYFSATFRRVPIALVSLAWVVGRIESTKESLLIAVLEEIGSIWNANVYPDLDEGSIDRPEWIFRDLDDAASSRLSQLTPLAQFGTFCTMATYFEASPYTNPRNLAAVAPFGDLLRMRLAGMENEDSINLEVYDWTANMIQIAEGWTRKNLNFVRPMAKRKLV